MLTYKEHIPSNQLPQVITIVNFVQPKLKEQYYKLQVFVDTLSKSLYLMHQQAKQYTFLYYGQISDLKTVGYHY